MTTFQRMWVLDLKIKAQTKQTNKHRWGDPAHVWSTEPELTEILKSWRLLRSCGHSDQKTVFGLLGLTGSGSDPVPEAGSVQREHERINKRRPRDPDPSSPRGARTVSGKQRREGAGRSGEFTVVGNMSSRCHGETRLEPRR